MKMDPRGRTVSLLLAVESLLRAGSYYITPYGTDTAFQVIANAGPIPLTLAGLAIVIANIPGWRSSRPSNRWVMLTGFAGHLVGAVFSLNIGAAILAWAAMHHTPFSTAWGYLFIVAPLHIMRMVDHGRRVVWTRVPSQQSPRL